MDYVKRLEQLRNEIEECNSVLAHYPLKVDDDGEVDIMKKIMQPNPIIKTSLKKKTKDRTYDLDKFVKKMNRVDQLRKEKDEMRQIMTHGRIKQEKTVTNIDTFMDELNKKRFCVPWNRLDTWQKKNRMKKYVSGLDITDSEKEELIRVYGDAIVKNSLGKNVKYDRKEGFIVSIKNDE